MMRSLYSAVSGLRNHQTKMDVIGNNIANVNTVGFKKDRTSFADMLSQTLQGASTPSATQGGTNPMQVGLGVTMGSIDTIMTQGSAETTGKDTDLMIQGDGFFVLNNNGQQVFTRAGNFDTDAKGNLVDVASGAQVQGYAFNSSGVEAATATPIINLVKGQTVPGLSGTATDVLSSFSIDQTGTITGIFTDSVNNTTTARKIAQLQLANFANPAGLANVGGNFYAVSNNSGAMIAGTAGNNGTGEIIAGALEMSNVDLSQEMTDMIVAQRGFQANSRVITVSDSLLEELINLKRS